MQLSFRQRLICWLAYLLIWVLHRSYRYRWYGLHHYEQARAGSSKSNPVIACWHQNALASALCNEGRRLTIIVSQSFDGEVISSVVKRFGIETARGSSTRGGLEALRSILKYSKNGWEAGITVDGPNGPPHVVKPGVIAIASLSSSAIVPLAAIGYRTWAFAKSWDKFRLPKPFSPILCVFGAPIEVPRKLDAGAQEIFLQRLHDALNDLESQVAAWRSAEVLPPAEHKGLRRL